MRNNIAIFAVTFLLGLGGGMLAFGRGERPNTRPASPPAATTPSPSPTAKAPAPQRAPEATDHAENVQDMAQQAAPATNASEDGADSSGAASPAQPAASTEIFASRGCVGCHSVSALDVQGGVTGPDLSKAFVNVPDKHGLPLNEFLKKPTSAVMSSVIAGSPLSDEDRTTIVNALKTASEK